MNEERPVPTTTLPGGELTGEEATWRLTTRTPEPDVVAGVLEFRGVFLGVGSSQATRHTDHAGDYATREEKCGACRWFETRIFRLGPNEYVLHHAGRSIVPGEVDLQRHERAYSPHEVIELYTIRKDDPDSKPFLNRPALRALAQAAPFDHDLSAVWSDRAWVT